MVRISIDNQYYYTDTEDFQNALNSFKIEGLSEYIQELESKADYNKQKINTDLDCYESQIEEYRNMLSDTMDELKTLRDSINDSKRINKDKVIDTLERIEDSINANL